MIKFKEHLTLHISSSEKEKSDCTKHKSSYCWVTKQRQTIRNLHTTSISLEIVEFA